MVEVEAQRRRQAVMPAAADLKHTDRAPPHRDGRRAIPASAAPVGRVPSRPGGHHMRMFLGLVLLGSACDDTTTATPECTPYEDPVADDCTPPDDDGGGWWWRRMRAVHHLQRRNVFTELHVVRSGLVLQPRRLHLTRPARGPRIAGPWAVQPMCKPPVCTLKAMSIPQEWTDCRAF